MHNALCPPARTSYQCGVRGAETATRNHNLLCAPAVVRVPRLTPRPPPACRPPRLPARRRTQTCQSTGTTTSSASCVSSTLAHSDSTDSPRLLQGPTCYDEHTDLHTAEANNCCRECLVLFYNYERREKTGASSHAVASVACRLSLRWQLSQTGDDEPDWVCPRCLGAAEAPGGGGTPQQQGNAGVHRTLQTGAGAAGGAADDGAAAKKPRLDGPEALPLPAPLPAPTSALAPVPAPALAPAATAALTAQSEALHCALREAAAVGDREALQAVMASRLPIHLSAPDGDTGSTALHLACQNGHADMAALLLRYNANAGATDKELHTPLHLAAGAPANSAALVQMLVARLDAKKEARDCNGMTPLLWAVFFAKADAAAALLAAGACVDGVHPPTGRTPLHAAAGKGFTELVTLLLSHGAAVDARNRQGLTPLACALVSKAGTEEKTAICTALLEAGAQLLVPSGCGDKSVMQLWLERSSSCPPELAAAVTHALNQTVTAAVDAAVARPAVEVASAAQQEENERLRAELVACREQLSMCQAQLSAVRAAAAQEHEAAQQREAQLAASNDKLQASSARAKERLAELRSVNQKMEKELSTAKALRVRERTQRLEAVDGFATTTRQMRAEIESLKQQLAAKQQLPGSAQRARPPAVQEQLWPALERELQPQLRAAAMKSVNERKALQMQLSRLWHPDKEKTGSAVMRALYNQAMQLINSTLAGP